MAGLPKKEDRMSSFKKGIDAKDGRRRRDDTRIQLRKNKREEGLMKRRAMGPSTGKETAETSGMQDSTKEISSNVYSDNNIYSVDHIPNLIAGLSNTAEGDLAPLDIIRAFRRMLSVEKNPPCRQVIDAGALPHFVRLLAQQESSDIQFESAWALTNIASSDMTASVVECGALPHLIALLRSSDANVREQCAWCIGNIAGDSPSLRDVVLEAGALEGILLNIAQPASPGLLGNVVWSLSNLCRGKPQPNLHAVSASLPHLASLLHNDGAPNDVLVDACWAFSYLSDGDDSRIGAVMDAGVTGRLVHLLSSEQPNLVTPALRTLGNFVSGSDGQTQGVIDAGVLDHVESLLAHPRKNIRKEACWLLSNIAAGTHYQIGHLLGKPRVLMAVIKALQSDQWEVRKEAAWVISNICTGGGSKHIEQIVELGAIEAIISTLDVADSKVVSVALEAIDAILKTGESLNKLNGYISFVDEADGIDKIESLQEHENDGIYEKAIAIIEKYFGSDDGLEDENLAPAVSGDMFAFGVPTKSIDGSGGAASEQPKLQPFNFALDNAPTAVNFSFAP